MKICKQIIRRAKRWIQKHVGWDDPEFDSTDWAHPAWFRGTLHGLHGAICLVSDIISGKETGVGAMYKDADKLRQMVLGLVRERGGLVRERDSLRCDVERLRLEVLRRDTINRRDDCG